MKHVIERKTTHGRGWVLMNGICLMSGDADGMAEFMRKLKTALEKGGDSTSVTESEIIGGVEVVSEDEVEDQLDELHEKLSYVKSIPEITHIRNEINRLRISIGREPLSWQHLT